MSDTSESTPTQRYREGVAAHRWEPDPAQQQILPALDRLHAALCAAPPEAGLFGRLKSMLADTPREPERGIYLWGSVGRGKTFLMDLLVSSLPAGRVRRRHFHRFMGDVHERLRELGHRSDPLLSVAQDLSERCRVLCLDEFLVNDIGDAMILGTLLEALFARGVSLVTTSNTAPENLYAGGLQRARFLPAIALLQRHCEVLEMASPRDWRLRALSQAPVYLHPPGAEAERSLARIFASQAQGEIVDAGTLRVHGRDVALHKRADNVLWFDFAALCEGPRSVADYIAVARLSSTVIVSNVPQFSMYSEDEARRFVQLVDEFYDRRVKLVLSAATAITELYDGERLRAEFGRTESRLIEMQSENYLALPHRPD